MYVFFLSLKWVWFFFALLQYVEEMSKANRKRKKLTSIMKSSLIWHLNRFSLFHQKKKLFAHFFFQWRHQIFIFISQNALRLNVKIINKRIIKFGDFFIIENAKWALTVLSMLKSKSNSKWIGKHDWNFNEEHHFS